MKTSHALIHNPPKIASKFLSWALPENLVEPILGDLSEEYLQRVSNNQLMEAKIWYWRQALNSGVLFKFMSVKNSLFKADLSQIISLAYGLIIFSIMLLLISWLSNVNNFEGFTINIQQALEQGSVHHALTQSQFWDSAVLNLANMNGAHYFFQFEACLWAIFSLITMHLLRKYKVINDFLFVALSNFVVFIPYLIGSFYLEGNDLNLSQAGELLAQMLFSIFYLILPVTYVTYNHLRARN